nr:uncharacterized protein LOC109989941 [Labrus bergylta]
MRLLHNFSSSGCSFRMGLNHVAVVVVLGLLSVGESAPVTGCESLIKPMDVLERDQLLGKWTLLAESTNTPGAKSMTDFVVESAWTLFTAANESGVIDVFQAEKMSGNCYTLKTKMTLENNTLSIGPPLNSSARLLSTGCPDCLVYATQYPMEESAYNGVQLMSRRNNVTDAELHEFRRQVGCLKLPPPVILNQDKGLCPQDSLQNTDLTNDFYGMSPEELETIFSGGDVMVEWT